MASAHPIRRHTVAPANVIKLMSAIGPTRAAARLGVSTTLLHKSRKDGAINQVVEIAAAHALEHLADPAPAPRVKSTPANDAVFLIAVPSDKAELVQRMASALGAELVAA